MVFHYETIPMSIILFRLSYTVFQFRMKKIRGKAFLSLSLPSEVAELLHIYEIFLTFVPSK
jgi:hypothetical protein